MKHTRDEIESEESYRKLQAIGKEFRADGHEITLSAPEKDLKKRLLYLFDEHYAKQETAEIENEKVDDETETVDEVEEVVEETIDETTDDEAEEKSPDPYDNLKLYYSTMMYRDWESGWSYDPKVDKPKSLPEKLSHGLKHALETKRIKRYVE